MSGGEERREGGGPERGGEGSAQERPPRWAVWLIGRLVPRRYREEHLGDLHEGWTKRSADPVAARRWYRRQVLRSVPGALRLRWRPAHHHEPERAPMMETIGQDLRYGWRSLRRNPGFAIVATVTLALAIGVNTSIFSLVSVIVFADVPMEDSEAVALVRSVNPQLEIERSSVSPADYLALENRARSFESVAAVTEAEWILTGGEQPTRVQGLQFTAGLTETWALPPILGRDFGEGEDRYGAAPVAMLTHGFWQERFGGRPDVLGETIRLDGVEHTIVGVTDPRLEWAMFRATQVVTPLVLNRGEPDRAARYLLVSGRLAEGVTHEMATEEVRRIGEALASEHPAENRGWDLWSAPVMEALVARDGRRVLLVLQLTVAMVILIACANVANMLLARTSGRSRELAVRSALGAGRLRLLRQLLTECLVISVAAAGTGLGLAWALNRALVWISAGTEEAFVMAEIDGPVLAFTLAVSLAAPLAFGLLPALRASATGTSDALRDGRSGDGGRSGKRTRGALVTAQVSLAMTLMIVAGLLVRTVANAQARPLGFDPSDLMTVELRLPESGYEQPEARIRFYAEAGAALARVPGLTDPELANVIPGVGNGVRRSVIVEGVEVPEGRASPAASLVTVSPGYFDLIGLPVVRGRGLGPTDSRGSPRVAVVSRRVAETFWSGRDPLGRRFRPVDSDDWLEVVGVVSDVRDADVEAGSAPNVYVPHDQDPRGEMYLVARTSRPAAELAGPIREAVWSVDPDQPVGDVVTMERAQHEAAASDYAVLTLFVTFAVFALAMAAVGIYGVMAYNVSRRRSEIGLRLALGADRRNVGWMVVSEGGILIGAGIALGLLASFLVSRLLANVVYGISATDPLTFVGVPVVLGAVALAANLIPAARAIRLDPARTLRTE